MTKEPCAVNAAQPAEQASSIEVHVGNRIKLARMLLGVTQAQLAALLGITYQQYSLFERGRGRMFASQLYEIARALNTTVEFFFQDLPSKYKAGRSAESEMQSDGRSRHYIRIIVRVYLTLSSSEQDAILAWVTAIADDPNAKLHRVSDSQA